jgi:tRNA threonylcarbamoyladenosine biosynthesis protein TsaB
MWLALETATERASVAVGWSAAEAVEESLAGARRHAAGLLPMIAAALDRAGGTLDDLTGLALSDGPGSFTGLRVGASVAKALAHARGLPLWTAPSLMVRASGVAREGDTVLAVADALRGEVYAAAYRFDQAEVVTVLAPSVYRPERLIAAAPPPSVLVGEAPTPAAEVLERWSGRRLVGPPEGGAHARQLIELVRCRGGAVRVTAVEGWAPEYGRPAEAQARWEAVHGRPMPDPLGSPR